MTGSGFEAWWQHSWVQKREQNIQSICKSEGKIITMELKPMINTHFIFRLCCDNILAFNSASYPNLRNNKYLVYLLHITGCHKYFRCLFSFRCGSAGKKSTCNAGDLYLIPGLGRSSGEGKGYTLQHSGLEMGSQKVRHDWTTGTFI